MLTARTLTMALATAGMLAAPIGAAAATPGVGAVVPAGKGVLISRGGRLIPVNAPTSLQAGDRVITRAGGAARVSANGCATNVTGMSVVALQANRCASVTSIKPSRSAAAVLGANAAQDDDNDGGTGGSGIGTAAVAVLAAAAVAAGIVVVASQDSSPQSP